MPNNTSLIDTLNVLLQKISIKEVSKDLNLSSSTIKRWIDLKVVPKNYEIDILKLTNHSIDYSKFSTKEKDQFFTPIETAKHCFDIFKTVIKEYNQNVEDFVFIEPSAGDGSFLNVLPNNSIALDIEPRHKNVIMGDFLSWVPPPSVGDKKYIVFGNPPFGLRGHLALKFINHSYEFADYVCFILPQLFESDGKGVPRKRVKGFNLLSSTKLHSDFYEPNGNTIKINTIFQVWSKHFKNDKYNTIDIKDSSIKIYSLSDGGTSASTRNKKMIHKCDVYLPSTCFGKTNMKCYTSFDELPNKRGYGIVVLDKNKNDTLKKLLETNWGEKAFLSTNSAYNLRSSQIYTALDSDT